MGDARPPLMPVDAHAEHAVARKPRYRVDDAAEGPAIVCDEAPGISVRVDPKHSLSEAAARKLGPRVILLDGAGQFPPLIDSKAQVYNLDHHEGCVRAFTLATCEQALVLVVKGVDLAKGAWNIYANEPDLDTVLAIWLLLNHRRIRDLSDAAREILLPLVRLEGATDANGREFAAYCGVPQPALDRAQRRLSELFRHEQGLREDKELGPCERTVELLQLFDAEIFTPAELASFDPIEEVYGNVELPGDLVAVACRDGEGIYSVEERLRALWGARLGLIALEGAPGRYTVRASAPLGVVDLDRLYSSLNLLDPAVTGRPASERWGGAEEIGGSPRERGSQLSPEKLLNVIAWTYQRRPQLLRKLWRATLRSLALAALGGLAALAVFTSQLVNRSAPVHAVAPLLAFSLAVAAGSLWLARRERRALLFPPAWRLPAGLDWIWLVPIALLGAALGGVWAPGAVGPSTSSLVLAALALAGAALGCEAWFRGWLQGLFVLERPERTAQDTWRVSRACVISTAFYCVATLLLAELGLERPALDLPGELPPAATSAAGAVLVGLALGVMRERARSVLPGVVTHAAGGALLLGLTL